MSANQGRLRSAIQRIAREDPEIRNTIDGFKDRGGFDSVSTQVAGAEDGRGICCDGSSSSNRNPGSDTRDPSENAKDGLDPNDPADISDNLTGVVDCETGVPISWEGGDLIPPDGWDDARSPPIDPDYQEGYFWYLMRGPIAYCCSVSATRAGAIAKGGCLPEGRAGRPVLRTCGGGGCRGGEDACDPSPDDLLMQQEPNGTVSLGVADGAIVGSKYDPDNDGTYYAPRSEIELCDPNNGERTLIRVDTDSTWKSIKSLNGDIDPETGYGYLWETATGRKVRQISPSEFRDDTV